MATWNGQAASTVQILKDISVTAASAASAVAKLSSAFGAHNGRIYGGGRKWNSRSVGRPLAMEAQDSGAMWPPRWPR